MGKLFLYLTFILIFCVSCMEQSGGSGEETLTSKYNVNLFSMNKLVCDPFEEGDPNVQGGLKAQLYTMANGERPNSLDTFFNSGLASDKDIFLSQLNVPTRVFSLGFPTETGEMIQADDGSDLVEWFALRMESVLKLSETDEEGDYELALLADDGARISIKNSNGVYEIAVDNDGLHPTKMGCGNTITMTRDTQVSVQIDYFQGPRWHISVIPMWRKVTSSTLPEGRCGQQGNSLFFDYNNNSSPQLAYQELLANGWTPIKAENWQIQNSDEGEFNPCTEGDGINITDFSVVKDTEDNVTLTWQTDKLATSQVLFKNLNTGQEYDSGSDNILRTQHTLQLDMSGLNVPFEFQGVSVAEDLSKAVSEAIVIAL